MNEQHDRRLLRVEDAARELSLGRSKIYQLLASGQLRSVAIGAARRIPREALDEYVGRLTQAEPITR